MRALYRWPAMLVLLAVAAAGCVRTEPSPVTAGRPTTTSSVVAPTSTVPPPSTTLPDRGKLVVWVDEVRLGPVTEVAAAFTAATGMAVDVETVPLAEAAARFEETAPAERPDLLALSHDGIGRLAAAGLIAEVEQAAVALAPAAVAAFRWEGRRYGLPFGMEALALFWNRALLDAPPASLEELGVVCASVTGVRCAGIPADFYHHAGLLAAYGGYVFGGGSDTGWDPGDVGVDGAAAQQGAAELARLIATGVLGTPAGYGDLAEQFGRGELALLWAGPWQLGPADDAGVDFAVAPLPTVAGRPWLPFVGVQGFAVREGAPPEAQALLLEYLAVPETVAALARADSRVPAVTTVAVPGGLAGFAAGAEVGVPIPNLAEMAAVWDPMDRAIASLYQGAGAAATLQTAATEIRQRVAAP